MFAECTPAPGRVPQTGKHLSNLNGKNWIMHLETRKRFAGRFHAAAVAMATGRSAGQGLGSGSLTQCWGRCDGTAALESRWAVSWDRKHVTATQWGMSCWAVCARDRKCVFPRHLHTEACGSSTCHGPELETSQVTFQWVSGGARWHGHTTERALRTKELSPRLASCRIPRERC